MQVSVPGIYQKPAPYSEQTLTYSTALAFTGRSAACAPPIATRAAAEPRTRLLIIFMLKPPSCSLFRRLRTPTGVFPFWAGSPKTAQSFRALHPPASCAGLERTTSRDDPGPPAVVGEYACAVLIIKIVYWISYSIAGTMYPFCNGSFCIRFSRDPRPSY